MPGGFDIAGTAAAGGVSDVWLSLHTGASHGSTDGVVRRRVCGVLPIPASQPGVERERSCVVNTNSTFNGVCPVPIQKHPRIQMAHGGGGKSMHQLLDEIFLPAFGAGPADQQHDSVVL